MFYGFTWTDEGLYLSQVHRLFTGDRLLIDDWTPTQFYAPLLYPLYSLFVKINGSTDGAFLFFRLITITLQFFTSVFAYFVFSQKNAKLPSLFASLLPLIFARACLNGPSYYTLGQISYFLGILCIYAVFSLNYNCFILIFSGIFFATAVLCNPFLIIPYIIISITVLIIKNTRKEIGKIFLIWAGSILCGIIYCIFVFSGSTVNDILTGLHYTYNDPSYKHSIILTIKRLYKMPKLLVFPYIITWLPLIITCVIFEIKKIEKTTENKFILQIINLALFTINCFYEHDCGSAIMPFLHFTIFSAYIFFDGDIKTFIISVKKEFLYFVLPGMILAYFFCFASDTGFGVCSIGMTIAAIGEIFIYHKIIQKKEKTPYLLNWLKSLPLIILFAFTLFYRTNNIYRDSPLPAHILFVPNFSKNTAKIESGPAKGLYTSIGNKKHYDNLYSLLSEIEEETQKSIFISGTATWAYIARPNILCSAPTTWRTFFDDARLQSYYENFPKKDLPDYILILNSDNPSNDGRYEKKNDYENIKETWLYTKLIKSDYIKKEYPSGILYLKN